MAKVYIVRSDEDEPFAFLNKPEAILYAHQLLDSAGEYADWRETIEDQYWEASLYNGQEDPLSVWVRIEEIELRYP